MPMDIKPPRKPLPHKANPVRVPQEDAEHQPQASRRSGLSNSAILAIVVVAVLVVGSSIIVLPPDQGDDNKSANSKTPEYQTILPESKSIKDLGGWQRISPPEMEPVFAYSDTVGDVPVIVSQQPLPEDFKADTSTKVAEMAAKFNATNKIDAGDTSVYIGTSAKGPQSAILTKNKLLIMIKSESKIDEKKWADYVANLN